MIKGIASRLDRAIHIRRIGQGDFRQQFSVRRIGHRPCATARTAGPFVVDKQLLMDQIGKGENPVKLSISAWNRTSLAGRDYMSLSVSEPFIPQPKADQQQKAAHDNSAEDDSDVPF